MLRSRIQKEVPMKTPSDYLESLKVGKVTPKIVGDVTYSFNKRAKNMRDKEREYRELSSNRRFFDIHDNEEKYRNKKEGYYQKKEAILNLHKPVCIHEVKRRVNDTLEGDFDKSSYESLIEYGSYERFDNFTRDYETFTRVSYVVSDYYLFYEIGGHSFHTPIDGISVHNELPIVPIDSLTTYGEDVNELLSVQFCDKVLDGLLSGALKIAEP